MDEPMFYSYAYPVPEALSSQEVSPDAASWNADLGEFLLPYEAVRSASDSEAALLKFLQTTYDAAADTAGWDRRAFEYPFGIALEPRPRWDCRPAA